MSISQGLRAVSRRVRVVLVLAVSTILCDALVAFTGYQNWRSYEAAPNNAYVQPADDGGAFVWSLVYSLTSALRYLLVATLVIVALQWRRQAVTGAAAGHADSKGVIAVGALVAAADIAYLAVASTMAGPSEGWYLWRLGTVVSSAGASAFLALCIGRNGIRTSPGAAQI